jgi:peptidoglycan/xylan/chitin deacetylase (PgdA/CDA1 family)
MNARIRHLVRVGATALVAAALAGCGSGTPPPSATSSGSTLAPTTSSTATSATGPTPIPTSSSTVQPTRPTASRTTSAPSRPTSTGTFTQPGTSTRPPTTSPAPTTGCTVPGSLRGKDLEVVPTTRKVVALTFDAGASNTGVASILSTLSRQGVPATFFLTGDFVDAYPSSARAMARYPIGNHTYNHPDLTDLTDSQVRNEIRSAGSRITAVTGQNPRPFFRFPYGAVNSRVIRIVNAECYVPFRWTVDTLGWKGTSGGQSVATVVNRVLAAARPGEIVLMHVGAHPTDGSTLDASALPKVISGLRAKGYSFVTLESVLPSAP